MRGQGGPNDTTERAAGPAPAPLGHLAATVGNTTRVRSRWERFAHNAHFQRKLAVLFPAGHADSIVDHLQLQKRSFHMTHVPVAALGDQGFSDVVKSKGMACISRGRGLHADNVLAVRPCGDLILSLDTPTYERLGVEEPAPGDAQLQRLGRLTLPASRRQVRIDLGVSKTRAKRAASTPAGLPPVSRWRSLVDVHDHCELDAYLERGESNDDEECERLAKLLTCDTVVRSVQVPVTVRRVGLGGIPVEMGTENQIGHWLEQLVSRQMSYSYGEACEDFLDWLGMLHLAVGDSSMEVTQHEEGKGDEGYLWVLGESLLGSRQTLHATDICFRALGAGLPWFVISMWGDEDAPVSHHGGAHGFDLTGSHHAHLLVVRSVDTTRCESSSLAPTSLAMLLESANVLHSTP